MTELYTWGLGATGQLGSGDIHNCLVPQSVKYHGKSPTHIKQISCGGLFTTVLTTDGSIMTTGCCKNGRLGHNSTENETKFKLVQGLDKNNKKISSGVWHGACINKDDNICIWGHPKPCGHPDRKMSSVPPTIIPRINVSGISCGFNYILAWSVDGQAYSFGSGHFGVLGHGSINDVSSPKLIDTLSGYKVTSMSAGYNHAGAVTLDGKLFMFGKGADGALGFGTNRTNQMKPKELVIPYSNVTGVSCSVGEHHGHTLAITDQGFVYSWGDGYKGKLGHDNQTSLDKPTQIDRKCFNMEFIIEVCAGGIHSCALSREGHVFTWGCGSDGRLGHPESEGHRYLFRSDVPRLVEYLNKQKVIQISCSYYHTAALIE